MPIHLEAPEYRPGGPDGRGWNRLTLNAHMGRPSDQCALRPRSYAALHTMRRSIRLAQWGEQYGHCTGAGQCGSCPVLNAAPKADIPWEADRVLIRIEPREFVDHLHAMQDPDAGWDSRSVRVMWDAVAQVDGWSIGRAYRDEHGDGFWLVRVDPEGTQP